MRSWIVAPLLAATVLAGCSDGTGPAAARDGQDPLVEQLVEMGFRRDQIRDAGDHFVVEGDIRFDKKALAAAPSPMARPGGPRGQRVVSTFGGTRRTIRVNLAAVQAENASWATATRSALTNWSSINGVDITLVEGTPADITVSFANNADFTWPCTVAQGSWPISGNPGTIVRINRLYAGSYAAAQQVWIMSHEFGHNLGLAHTNSSDGTHISGTPTSDAGSVMNSGGSSCPPAAPNWSAFSAGDQAAVFALYPMPGPSVSATQGLSGNTVLSWSGITGALYYQVRRNEMYREWNSFEEWSYEYPSTGAWVDVYATSYDTDASWTGTSSCHWDYGQKTEASRNAWYEVHAVYASGIGPTVIVDANDLYC
ncbi:MAG TPA: M57 family metalloprotease [Longimicrobium sp.]|nr:M57 family metalloprotease [Longimicrobium sp.]